LPHTSPFASVDFGARARYFPEPFATRIEYEPVLEVVPVPTVRHLPFTRCWILTGTVAAHAAVPSVTLTAPLARSFPLKDSEIDRRCLIVNGSALLPVPVGVVTEIGPVVAPFGTVAVICVPEFTVNAAVVPLNFNDVAPVRFPPVMTTCVPHGPMVGVNEAMNGLVTTKSAELVPVPPGPVTEIFPVVAVAGTVALICVSESILKVGSAAPLKSTAVAPVNPVPVMVTFVPTGPLTGRKEVIWGAGAEPTVKSVALVAVPLGVVTVTGPLCAPFWTVAVTCVFETTTKAGSALLPIITWVAPVKFVPVIVTLVPADPKFGVNDEMVGPVGFVTVKSVALVAVLTGVVTPIFPVVAPEGTVAVICVFESTANTWAAVALNVTADAPHRFVPVIVTAVPTGPLVGLKELMDAATLPVTVKFAALLTMTASAPVTEIFPVAAPPGTVAVIFNEEFTVYEAAVPLNATAVAPVKFVPLIVTEVPTGPHDGVNEEIEALAPEVTMKSSALVTVVLLASTTETLPVWAPTGTVAVMLTFEFTV